MRSPKRENGSPVSKAFKGDKSQGKDSVVQTPKRLMSFPKNTENSPSSSSAKADSSPQNNSPDRLLKIVTKTGQLFTGSVETSILNFVKETRKKKAEDISGCLEDFQALLDSAFHFYSELYGFPIHKLPALLEVGIYPAEITPIAYVEVLSFLNISPKDTNFYWIGELLLKMPLPPMWEKVQDGSEVFNSFLYFNINTPDLNFPFPPGFEYCKKLQRYLKASSLENNSLASKEASFGIERVTFRDGLSRFYQLDVKKLYELTLQGKLHEADLKKECGVTEIGAQRSFEGENIQGNQEGRWTIKEDEKNNPNIKDFHFIQLAKQLNINLETQVHLVGVIEEFVRMKDKTQTWFFRQSKEGHSYWINHMDKKASEKYPFLHELRSEVVNALKKFGKIEKNSFKSFSVVNSICMTPESQKAIRKVRREGTSMIHNYFELYYKSKTLKEQEDSMKALRNGLFDLMKELNWVSEVNVKISDIFYIIFYCPFNLECRLKEKEKSFSQKVLQKTYDKTFMKKYKLVDLEEKNKSERASRKMNIQTLRKQIKQIQKEEQNKENKEDDEVSEVNSEDLDDYLRLEDNFHFQDLLSDPMELLKTLSSSDSSINIQELMKHRSFLKVALRIQEDLEKEQEERERELELKRQEEKQEEDDALLEEKEEEKGSQSPNKSISKQATKIRKALELEPLSASSFKSGGSNSKKLERKKSRFATMKLSSFKTPKKAGEEPEENAEDDNEIKDLPHNLKDEMPYSPQKDSGFQAHVRRAMKQSEFKNIDSPVKTLIRKGTRATTIVKIKEAKEAKEEEKKRESEKEERLREIKEKIMRARRIVMKRESEALIEAQKEEFEKSKLEEGKEPIKEEKNEVIKDEGEKEEEAQVEENRTQENEKEDQNGKQELYQAIMDKVRNDLNQKEKMLGTNQKQIQDEPKKNKEKVETRKNVKLFKELVNTKRLVQVTKTQKNKELLKTEKNGPKKPEGFFEPKKIERSQSLAQRKVKKEQKEAKRRMSERTILTMRINQKDRSGYFERILKRNSDRNRETSKRESNQMDSGAIEESQFEEKETNKRSSVLQRDGIGPVINDVNSRKIHFGAVQASKESKLKNDQGDHLRTRKNQLKNKTELKPIPMISFNERFLAHFQAVSKKKKFDFVAEVIQKHKKVATAIRRMALEFLLDRFSPPKHISELIHSSRRYRETFESQNKFLIDSILRTWADNPFLFHLAKMRFFKKPKEIERTQIKVAQETSKPIVKEVSFASSSEMVSIKSAKYLRAEKKRKIKGNHNSKTNDGHSLVWKNQSQQGFGLVIFGSGMVPANEQRGKAEDIKEKSFDILPKLISKRNNQAKRKYRMKERSVRDQPSFSHYYGMKSTNSFLKPTTLNKHIFSDSSFFSITQTGESDELKPLSRTGVFLQSPATKKGFN